MTESRDPRDPLAWVRDHLWAILAAAFAAYGGYVTGMTTLTSRMTALEGRVAAMEAKQRGRSDFMVCATRNLDKVFDKLGAVPACPMEVPE